MYKQTCLTLDIKLVPHLIGLYQPKFSMDVITSILKLALEFFIIKD